MEKKIRNLIAGLTFLTTSLFPSFSPSETRISYIENHPVKIEVNEGNNYLGIKVTYNEKERLHPYFSVEELYLNRSNSRIYFILPKSVKVINVSQYLEVYDKASGKTFTLTGFPPSKLEKMLEEIGNEVVLNAITTVLHIPGLAVEIGKALEAREQRKRKKFVEELEKENKGYAVEIEIQKPFYSTGKIELSYSLDTHLSLSESAKRFLEKLFYPSSILAEGAIYLHLVFDRGVVKEVIPIKVYVR